MPNLEQVYYALWVATPLLQVAVVLTLVYRRLAREFPLFLAYTAFHVLRFAVQFGIVQWRDAPYSLYFYSYWVNEFLGAALGVAVIYEIYRHVFVAYPGWQRLGRVLFHCCAGLLVLVAVVAAAATSATGFSQIVRSLLAFGVGSMIVRAGLILFLFVVSMAFRFTWRTYVFAIALGFGLYTIVEVAASAALAAFGWTANTTYKVVRAAAYDSATLIWLSALLRREPVAVTTPAVSGSELTQWNAALAEFLGR